MEGSVFIKFVSYVSSPEWCYSFKQPPVSRHCCHGTFIHSSPWILTKAHTHAHTYTCAHMCTNREYFLPPRLIFAVGASRLNANLHKEVEEAACAVSCFQPGASGAVYLSTWREKDGPLTSNWCDAWIWLGIKGLLAWVVPNRNSYEM